MQVLYTELTIYTTKQGADELRSFLLKKSIYANFMHIMKTEKSEETKVKNK